MKIIKKIFLSDYTWYSICQNGVFIHTPKISNKAEVLYIDVNNQEFGFEITSTAYGGIIINDGTNFYFKDGEKNYLAYNSINKTIKNILHFGDKWILSGFADKFILSELLPFDKKNLINKEVKKVFYEKDKIKWDTSTFGDIQIYKDIVICYTDENPETVNRIKSKFSKLNYETGQKEWDFDLNDHLDKIISAYPYDNAPFDGPLQVKEVIGVYKNQLWFAMSNYGLLCLENTTGEFMHFLRDCPQNPAGDVYLPYGGYPVLPFTENAVLLPDEGKIIVLDSMFYWQLDLETLELDFHFLEDYFKEVDCYTFSTRYKKLIVEGEKIYIVAYRSKKFACFNRRTLKYDWIEPLPEGSGAPRSIEKHGNKLYIDTSKKELLVYELEGNE